MLLKTLIICKFVCIVFFVNLISTEQLYPNCSRSQFDHDLSKIIGLFGVRGTEFPVNDKEMEKYCSLSKINEELTKSFIDRCLTGYSKTVMFIFSNNLKLFIQQFCGEKPTQRENFIKWSECGNKGKEMGTNRCWNRLMTNLWKTRRIEDSQDRVPSMCCNFLTWRTCTMDILNSIGSPVCEEEAIEGYDQQIKKSTLDVLQVLCDEYFEEPTMCEEVNELMPRFDPSKRRRIDNKTPFLALFKIFESLH